MNTARSAMASHLLGMALAGKWTRAVSRVHPARRWRTRRRLELGSGLAAAHYKLDNLVAILDHNTLQITGHTRDVMSNEPSTRNGARSAGRPQCERP
jgi:transketolase